MRESAEGPLLLLERITAALHAAPRDDLDAIASLLAERGEAIEALTRLSPQIPQQEADWVRQTLQAAIESGDQLEKRLLLSIAALRHELARLHQDGFLVRTLAPVAPACGPERINCTG